MESNLHGSSSTDELLAQFKHSLEQKNHVPDREKLAFMLEVKRAYNEGKLTLSEARKQLARKVTRIEPWEIALAEQELEEFSDNQCKTEDIQGMLALYQGLMDTSRPKLPPHHPIAVYYAEVDEVEKRLRAIDDLVQYPVIANQWLEIYDQLEQFKVHLSRKQNQLYPLLEIHGFDRPSTTMWQLDDLCKGEISEGRKLLQDLDAAAMPTAEQEDAFIAHQKTLVEDIRDLMQKEQTVLYPTSLALITAAEFADMPIGDQEIGFCLIENPYTNLVAPAADELTSEQAPLGEKTAGTSAALNPSNPSNPSNSAVGEGFVLNAQPVLGSQAGSVSLSISLDALLAKTPLAVSTGSLTLEQINLIFKHMPVDLSYVDEKEIVKFYSDTAHRIFPRSKNVIGRNVMNCHPRTSAHVVREIIDRFRSGEQNFAEFWINKSDVFIYISYTAVHDKSGAFRGILEMMQDCTHIRALQGSQTLLTWSEDQSRSSEDSAVSKDNAAPEDTATAGDSTTDQTAPTENAASEAASTVNSTRIELTPETPLKALLERYPELKARMQEIDPVFKALQTPLARIMVPKAKLANLCERSGLSFEELSDQLTALIASIEKNR